MSERPVFPREWPEALNAEFVEWEAATRPAEMPEQPPMGLDQQLAAAIRERDTDTSEALISDHGLDPGAIGQAAETRAASKAEARRLHYGRVGVGAAPEHCAVWWTCPQCGHETQWEWEAIEIVAGSPVLLSCERCDERTRFRMAERPSAGRVGRASACGLPLIQHGQAYARDLRALSWLIANNHWSAIQREQARFATLTEHSANALAEFGAPS